MSDPLGSNPSPSGTVVGRTILHVDMDAFFAAVEQLDNPELRGRPVLVGGAGGRGVVAAASYEARAYGCRSAMPSAVARRLCPHAVFVKGRHERYREVSHRVFEILERATPIVEPLSIDEAFLDVAGSARLLGDGAAIGAMLRANIRDELRLTASVGVAPNKFLAKLASDLHKPDGLTVINHENMQRVLDPLPVGRMWGVGSAAEARLHRLGVRTFADIRAMNLEALRAALGAWGERIHALARGEDDRPVVPDHEAKSIGHETTFFENLGDPEDVRAALLRLTENAAFRLRRKGRRARVVTVKIRFGDFETITRARTLDTPTDRTDDLWHAARACFDDWAAGAFSPVRLIGVSTSRFEESAQGMLFAAGED